jgi:nucleoside-triphosphatase
VQNVKRVLLLTGSPGVGKTTVLTKAVTILKEKGFSVGGMVSRETRKGGVRVGFEILDLGSEKRGWLAHVNHKVSPQVGKYRVNIEDLENIGAQAIEYATEYCNVIAIDGVGPMELFSEKFREATRKALESQKRVIVVVHWNAHDRLIHDSKTIRDSETFTVTLENRNELIKIIVAKATEALEKSGY